MPLDSPRQHPHDYSVSIIEAITQKVQDLPVHRQREVLDFVESLGRKPHPANARHDPEGMLAGQLTNLTLDEFKDARGEM